MEPQRVMSQERRRTASNHIKTSQRRRMQLQEKIKPIIAYPDNLLGPVLVLCGKWRGLDLEGWLDNKVDVDLAHCFGSPVVKCSAGG